MVSLSIKFDQLYLKLIAYMPEYIFQSLEVLIIKHFTSIFGGENQVGVKLKSAVPTFSYCQNTPTCYYGL